MLSTQHKTCKKKSAFSTSDDLDSSVEEVHSSAKETEHTHSYQRVK